jgi:glucokinase
VILVGDVGGTHARFAVVDTDAKPWRIDRTRDLAEAFPTFTDCLKAYLDRSGVTPLPEAISLAVAGPVTAGAVALTNRAWSISEKELKAFGFKDALLVNDFAALAFSVESLATADCRTIGPELAGLSGEPISIIGAGTGFGAACLARFHGRSVAVATEGGHAGFAPGNEAEIEVLRVLARRFGHVSIERVLSGQGLENLHIAIAEIAGRKAPKLEAAQIVAHADADCRAAVAMFCAVYGSVAGDFALAHGARGGVYLAGGIAQKIEATLRKSEFRARFENKGRMSGYVTTIPTRLVIGENIAFLGAARASLEFRA